jgi:hypothetical protein
VPVLPSERHVQRCSLISGKRRSSRNIALLVEIGDAFADIPLDHIRVFVTGSGAGPLRAVGPPPPVASTLPSARRVSVKSARSMYMQPVELKVPWAAAIGAVVADMMGVSGRRRCAW